MIPLEEHPGREPLTNTRWETFCLAFIASTANDKKRQAAIKAGYNAKSASVRASELLAKQAVADRIEFLARQILEELKMGAEESLAELASVARADFREILSDIRSELVKVGETKDGKIIYQSKTILQFKPFEEMNTKIIKRIYMDRSGNPVIELQDKVGALDKVTKLLGLHPKEEKKKDELPLAQIDQETEEARMYLLKQQEKA